MKARTLFLRLTVPGNVRRPIDPSRGFTTFVKAKVLATIPCKKVSVGGKALWVTLPGKAKGLRFAVYAEDTRNRGLEARFVGRWHLTEEAGELLGRRCSGFVSWSVV